MKSTVKPRKRRLKNDQGSFSDQHLVSIVAPSIELFNKIHEACSVLENFGIPYETAIVAAHRSPNKAIKYASGLEVRGIEVVLACGTGSAHLPGMIASLTNLPVIGIPLTHASSLMGGFSAFDDSDASRGPCCHSRFRFRVQCCSYGLSDSEPKISFFKGKASIAQA